jgi:hypothetical protein
MITADDHVIGAVVSPDDRVPDGFSWSGHAHGERQE